jgi:hypothetical protein
VRFVYLDQNKWIDLARAATGHPRGAAFVDVLAAATEAARQQLVCFPLSAAHYFETSKVANEDRRRTLATIMLELSGMTTIAPPQVIVPWELENALLEVFNLDGSRPEIELFGLGATHALATDSLAYRAPSTWEGKDLPENVRAELQRRLSPVIELALLGRIAPPGVLVGEATAWLNDARRLTDDRFVAGQRDVRRRLDDVGRQRLPDLMLATAVVDIIDPLMSLSAKYGIAQGQLFDDPDVARELIRRAHSRWVDMELRRVRQANRQKDFEGNDLNDLVALSIAVPYCDIVVTERMWTGMINGAKINQPFDTAVISDLRYLPPLLSASTVAS